MMTRVLAVTLGLALASSVAGAARGTVTLDRVGTTTPRRAETAQLSAQPAVRTYRPTTGGPTYSIRVPKGSGVRDASMYFITPTSTTQRSDIYSLPKGLFMVAPTKSSSDLNEKGEILSIDPK